MNSILPVAQANRGVDSKILSFTEQRFSLGPKWPFVTRLLGLPLIDVRITDVVVPLGSLLLSDLLLHLTYLAGWQPYWGFYRGQWVIYACFLATILVGFLLRRRRTVSTVAMATPTRSRANRPTSATVLMAKILPWIAGVRFSMPPSSSEKTITAAS